MRCIPGGSTLLTLCALLVAPSAGDAQIFRSRHDPTALGGASAGVPVTLYEGRITYLGGTARATGTLRYLEEVDLREELWVGFTTGLFDEHYVFFRGRIGEATSTATYGNIGPFADTFERSTSWLGGDLLGAIKLADTDLLRGTLYFGPSMTRYTLQTRGTGPDAVARTIGRSYGVEVEELEWSDVSWTSLDWIVGGEARLRVAGPVGVAVGLESRILHTPTGELARTLEDDIADAVGDAASVTLSGFDPGLSPSLTVALEWTLPGGGGERSPAEAAVEAVGERHASGEPVRPPPLPPAATRALAAGDTAEAIDALRARLESDDESAALWGTLGTLLAHHAPAAETDYEERLEAREALDRALKLDPGNPRWLLGISVLLERQGAPVDAYRVGERALEAAAERPEAIAPDELAEAFYRRARALERHVLAFEDLRFLATDRPPVNTPECSGLGAFCLNWARPSWFFGWFEPLTDLSSLVEYARRQMLEELRRAVEIVPSHRRANRMLLAWHARHREWGTFRERAGRYAEAASGPARPWARVFLATGLNRTGRVEEAAPLFNEGVDGLPAVDREIFTNLRPLLGDEAGLAWDTLAPAEREAYRGVYWKKSDPLYLTAGNEREMEHYARVALAEVLFGEPRAGRRGWETDRGDILVRYGLPETRWQIRREDRIVLETEDWERAEQFSECANTVLGDADNAADLMSLVGFCEPGAGNNISSPDRGGRWVFWNYDPDVPSFVFEKDLGSLTVRHMAASRSRVASEELRETSPATFEPPFHDAGPLDYQLARFRAEETGTYEVAVYARAPRRRLAAASTDTIRRGIFVFHGPEHRTVVSEEDRIPARDGRMDFRVELSRGLYAYSIEASSASGDTASVSRGELAVGRYRETELRLSDLLLTRTLEAPEGETVASYRDLDFMPMRCLALPVDRTVGVVFEIYELATEDGRARYRVTVETGEEGEPGVVARILREVANLFRDEEAGTVSFEREVELGPDERAVEWFRLEVPEEAGEEVEVDVTVTDLVTGEATAARRTVRAGACRA